MGKKSGSSIASGLGLAPLAAVKSLFQPIESTASSVILVVNSTVAAALPFLPYDIIDKNRVPTMFFKGRPPTFHVFIISIMFAFSGSFSSLFLLNGTKLARICLFYSMVSAVAAFLIMMMPKKDRQPVDVDVGETKGRNFAFELSNIYNNAIDILGLS
ncbi:unnamed protein product [Ilex paraguariensis]|uniref:Uncharacterized protein n=1 Tax=Ilex paraguariensis TaxID=185542 RepID=A0ABC8S0C9_9AQUA